MPKITIMGDVHGHFDLMITAIKNEQPDFVLQVGDMGIYLQTSNLSALPKKFHSDLGNFEEYFKNQTGLPCPVYFCKGNHEDFEFLMKHEKNSMLLPNLFYIPNGQIVTVQGVRIAFLGGNFSKKWFEKPVPKFFQTQKALGYIRKSEIDAIIEGFHNTNIDVLITHEPPTGLSFSGPRTFGCDCIRELIEHIQPAWAFSGHIHKYGESTIGKTMCVCLGALQYKDRSVYTIIV